MVKRLDDPSLNSMEEPLRIYNAVNLTCADVDRTFLSEIGGTTANVCLLVGEDLWVVNLGDSRALLVTPEKTMQLSKDQIPDENRELIEARGGIISDDRVTHRTARFAIAPGRGLGDHDLKGAMSPRPVISIYHLPRNREGFYLVQASDGVFNSASSDQVAKLVRNCIKEKLELSRAAASIAQRAIEAGSEDNISVIVKKLEK